MFERAAHVADPLTGDTELFLRVPNPVGQLKPGQACQCQIWFTAVENAVTVPVAALSDTDGASVVTVVRDRIRDPRDARRTNQRSCADCAGTNGRGYRRRSKRIRTPRGLSSYTHSIGKNQRPRTVGVLLFGPPNRKSPFDDFDRRSERVIKRNPHCSVSGCHWGGTSEFHNAHIARAHDITC